MAEKSVPEWKLDTTAEFMQIRYEKYSPHIRYSRLLALLATPFVASALGTTFLLADHVDSVAIIAILRSHRLIVLTLAAWFPLTYLVFDAFRKPKGLWGTDLDPRRDLYCFGSASILVFMTLILQRGALEFPAEKLTVLLLSMTTTSVIAAILTALAIVEEYHFGSVAITNNMAMAKC